MSNNNGSTSTPPDDTEKAYTPLEILIGEEKQERLPPRIEGASCSNYRVPETSGSPNPRKAFSIGPLHRGNETLQDMEEHKFRGFDYRAPDKLWSLNPSPLHHGNETLQDMEEHIYSETLKMELASLSPPSALRCIHRVPDRFRREREKDYTPRVISIGPYHHKNQDLKRMEVHKRWYLNCFMSRSPSKLNDYIKKIREQEEKLRQCYTETIELTRDEFVTMVLVDAIFLIEFLIRYPRGDLQDKNDCIFGIPMMRPDVQTDLLMLENQLPLFILKDLFSLYNPESDGGDAKRLSIEFLLYQASCSFGVELKNDSSPVEGQHFVDLLRNLLVPPLTKEKFKGEKKSAIAPSIEKLHLAGGKIHGETSNPNLFAIRFDDKWILKSRILKKGIPMKGVLKIPKLKIEDSTEVVLRNLIAFEQCSISEDPIICHYVILMDMLVDNPKDVELLVKHQIIENHLLGDDQEVPSMINRLSKGIVYDNFYYGDLCGKMDKFCNSNWPKWMKLLRSKYFNTPWSILSVGAAVVLLILTAIQTICSI